MTVVDLIEPQRQSRLKVGMLAAAMIPSASAPGTLLHDEPVMAGHIDILPSGCADASKYWGDFTLVPWDKALTVPPVLSGSGSGSMFTKTTKAAAAAQHTDVVAPLSHNETIAGIRSALSLQIKELSEIIHVQRPTIYSWINEEVEPSAGNRERLQRIYRIAVKWTRRCNLPMERLVRAAGADGHSVLDLLKVDQINEEEVFFRFDGLAAERLKMKAEADKKRPTAAATADRYGLRSDEISDQQHLIDAETGKRSHPD